jgi:chromate reductase
MKHHIGIIVGSLRKDSFNRKLSAALVKLAPKELTFRQIAIHDLPLYNQDDDANPDPSVRRLKAEIAASDAILFVTPEYNRSIPGVLKNALDHASRPYGESVWAGKPAGIVGISVGASGTSMAQQHLRNILAYLDMPAVGQPEIFLKISDDLFASDNSIAPESTRKLLHGWLERFTAWVEQHKADTAASMKQASRPGA